MITEIVRLATYPSILTQFYVGLSDTRFLKEDVRPPGANLGNTIQKPNI